MATDKAFGFSIVKVGKLIKSEITLVGFFNKNVLSDFIFI